MLLSLIHSTQTMKNSEESYLYDHHINFHCSGAETPYFLPCILFLRSFLVFLHHPFLLFPASLVSSLLLSFPENSICNHFCTFHVYTLELIMSTVFSFLLLYQLEVEFRFHSNVNSGEINKFASLVSYDMYKAIFFLCGLLFIYYLRNVFFRMVAKKRESRQNDKA